MRITDLIEINHGGPGVLWMLRSGDNAGMTSLVSTPHCWAFTITNRRLTVQKLEWILYEAIRLKILKPDDLSSFGNLEVELTEFGDFHLLSSKPDQEHG